MKCGSPTPFEIQSCSGFRNGIPPPPQKKNKTTGQAISKELEITIFTCLAN